MKLNTYIMKKSIRNKQQKLEPKLNLIVFSHLRWGFVFQRPQHLLSRAAKYFNVIYIEEPIVTEDENFLKIVKVGDVTVIEPMLRTSDVMIHVQQQLLLEYFDKNGIDDYIFWYYTPMALPLTERFSPLLVVFDVMDQLSAFKYAPKELIRLEEDLLEKADLVFTGGHSLYLEKLKYRDDCHLFPSSIDFNHFAKARNGREIEPEDQKCIKGIKLGYFGVIDERFDIELISQAAHMRPDWQFIMIGPIVKIDPETLPHFDNIHYLGQRDYETLPNYIAGWDIALIPFALNESTRFISPTKTPEYLAAGKPCISTSITDVVTPYGNLGYVDIVSDAKEFVAVGDRILSSGCEIFTLADEFLAQNSWNSTWQLMNKLIDTALEEKICITISS